MRVVVPKESYSSSEVKESMPIVMGGLIILGILLTLILIVVLIPDFHGYISFVSLFVVGILFVLKRTKLEQVASRIGNFRFGDRGEEEVFKLLENSFDDSYVYVRNYIIPSSRIGDIDGLLICPKGIIIIEIKNYVGVFRISSTDMFRKLKADIYKLYSVNPFSQVTRQKESLEEYLKDKGINIKVTTLIALVSGRIEAIVGETGTFITESRYLAKRISSLSEIPNWTPGLSEKILTALVPQKP